MSESDDLTTPPENLGAGESEGGSAESTPPADSEEGGASASAEPEVRVTERTPSKWKAGLKKVGFGLLGLAAVIGVLVGGVFLGQSDFAKNLIGANEEDNKDKDDDEKPAPTPTPPPVETPPTSNPAPVGSSTTAPTPSATPTATQPPQPAPLVEAAPTTASLANPYASIAAASSDIWVAKIPDHLVMTTQTLGIAGVTTDVAAVTSSMRALVDFSSCNYLKNEKVVDVNYTFTSTAVRTRFVQRNTQRSGGMFVNLNLADMRLKYVDFRLQVDPSLNAENPYRFTANENSPRIEVVRGCLCIVVDGFRASDAAPQPPSVYTLWRIPIPPAPQ